MNNHNCNTSRHYKNRWENQIRANEELEKNKKALEARRDELKKAVAGVYNIAQLNAKYPSAVNMNDIINLLDSTIHED